jgi:uncharacterized damage-inducible protein DinB
MNDDFGSLFAYNRWADRRVLGACRQLSPEQYAAEPAPGWSSVRASVVHVASATQNWVLRLAGQAVSGPLTEAEVSTVEEAERRLDRAYQMLDGLWPALTPERLAAPRPFELRGKSVALPPWVVLRHVVNHSTYHRGQIASKLKRFGVEQPATDFFLWARDQLPPQA